MDGDRLRYDAPAGALTPALRTLLQEHKGDVIALLRERNVPAQAQMGVVTAPASFVQRHFFTLQDQDRSACCFNVPFAYHLEGRLDVTALQRGFDEIVRRHEFLRTTLQTIDGALIQVVAATGDLKIVVNDLRGCPPEGRSDETDRLIQAELTSPFDLSSEACMRVRLLQLGDDEHILLFCLHNIMGEDGSLGALLKELGVQYQAFLDAVPGTKPAPMPPLPMQYADYARSQAALLSSDMGARVAYWQQWFAKGEPPLLMSAIAKPPAAHPTFRAGVVWHQFPSELTIRLRRLSQRAGVSLFVSVVAGYAALLSRYSGRTDIVVGGPAANRSNWKLEGMIGSTLSLVAFRFDLAGDPDIFTLLARVRSTVVAALSYQDVPFPSMAPLLKPVSQRSNPLFRTVLTFSENTPHSQLRLANLAVTFLEKITNREVRPELFPVMWEDHEAEGALTSYWLYREDLFSSDSIEQLVRDYEAVLTAMAEDPGQTLDSLPTAPRMAGS